MEKTTQIAGIDRGTYAGQAVSAIQKKARAIIGEESIIANLIDFTAIMLINNKFANKGIYITDDNKEECYIKIIELGDESLINDLERFINLKDKIRELEAKVEEYNGIVQRLQSLQDHNNSQEVNQIVEDYLRR